MAYSDFDLRKVRTQFQLAVEENTNLFPTIQPLSFSEHLSKIVHIWIPKAIAVGTEKARSEFIIAPILMELADCIDGDLNIFSGVAFDVDKGQGLNGACDFILTRSPERYYVSYPIVVVFEAKKEDVVAGFGQCLAVMVAAWRFNKAESELSVPIYGVVTSGDNWKFLRLENQMAWIDSATYQVGDIGKILAILVEILNSSTTSNCSAGLPL